MKQTPEFDTLRLRAIAQSTCIEEIREIISKPKIAFDDYIKLLSDAATDVIEELAMKANEMTCRQFGKTILLYAPLYLGNECDNCCVYCGFSRKLSGKRMLLTVEDAVAEADVLYQQGFRHILLVSGDKRNRVTMDYLRELILRLHRKFSAISIEIYALDEAEYGMLHNVGVDGLTIYQEVYDRQKYHEYHPDGPKSDYDYRLQAPERAARAGFYRLNIGCLLGLGPWFSESAALGFHLAYLSQVYWRCQLVVSIPRLSSSAAQFKVPNRISDAQLVQLICALRIFMPSLGISLSTREKKELRDHLIPIGITQMSAGSQTNPGGYSGRHYSKRQFEVADHRSLEQVIGAIAAAGYEPVFKDWDHAFIGQTTETSEV